MPSGMRRLFVAATMAALALGVTAPGAMAGTSDGDTGYRVTIAARTCPTYTDITANRARNDIQESLENLGADTPYTAGQPIDPAIEDANQPACSPLPDWRFTLGKGIKTKAVIGPWGALSIVTEPYATDIVTQPSVPLLNTNGAPTGDTIDGAVTIELTEAQLKRAQSGNSFWIQGGTVTDPILNEVYPGEYGFGALRCAIDNLNGDNVEWISYPSGAEHVFCYAYYVQPPPTSGTIIIRKTVAGVPGRSHGDVRVRRQPELQPRRRLQHRPQQTDDQGGSGVLPRGRRDLDGARDRPGRLDAHRPLVHRDGCQHYHCRSGRGKCEHRPGGGRQGRMHLHQHAAPAGGRAVHPQDHQGRRGGLRLRRLPAGRRPEARGDERGPRKRTCPPRPSPARSLSARACTGSRSGCRAATRAPGASTAPTAMRSRKRSSDGCAASLA